MTLVRCCGAGWQYEGRKACFDTVAVENFDYNGVIDIHCLQNHNNLTKLAVIHIWDLEIRREIILHSFLWSTHQVV
jgi:hypothetical protein